MTAVNPHEGQVAIPYARAAGGVVVGRLGARAMRWVEEQCKRSIDEVYADFAARAMSAGMGQALPVSPMSLVAAVIWASIEHERRLQRGPGPEYTIDDADEIIEQVGIDDAYSYALALVQLSAPWKKRTAALEEFGATKGADPVGPLRAAATAAIDGTGTPSSPPPSTPVSPTSSSGS